MKDKLNNNKSFEQFNPEDLIAKSDTIFSSQISINSSNGKPIIELKYNGDIFIKGKLIENDIEVVNGMRELLGFLVK